MKNVLVTGGAGYIGSHIIELLVKKRVRVFILDNLSTGYKRLINKKAIFYKTDIKNYRKIKNIIVENNIDSIIHLAAKLNVTEAEKKPKKYFDSNVIGTLNLLKASLNSKVRNFIFSSTCAVYKNNIPFANENSSTKPYGVYGRTKLKGEKLVKKYFKGKNKNYAILRYFNVVGASQSKKIGQINRNGQLFKNLSIEILKRKPTFTIYGKDYKTSDGTCIRDYIHVSDLADIHIKALKKINKRQKSIVLNCGYGKGLSVLEVVNQFKKFTNKKIKVRYKKKREGDMVEIIANVSKLKKFIKWKPKFFNLKKIVKSSIAWEKNIS